MVDGESVPAAQRESLCGQILTLRAGPASVLIRQICEDAPIRASYAEMSQCSVDRIILEPEAVAEAVYTIPPTFMVMAGFQGFSRRSHMTAVPSLDEVSNELPTHSTELTASLWPSNRCGFF
mmetsp:Transcript_11629/g.35517  ORF Transcript_11629/g.35517 Transcript_11629/m.35517 type:complete len:122 (+) Transcript_11629:188-553(+)